MVDVLKFYRWNSMLHATITKTSAMLSVSFRWFPKRRNLRYSHIWQFSLTWNRNSYPDPPMACVQSESLGSMNLDSRHYSIGFCWNCYRYFGGPSSFPACVGCSMALYIFWKCYPWRQIVRLVVICNGGSFFLKINYFRARPETANKKCSVLRRWNERSAKTLLAFNSSCRNFWKRDGSSLV